MTRLSRLVVASVALAAAACSSPTAPSAAKKPTPNTTPLMECVGGWDIQNGRSCG
jgi:hypothetical protein